jgi:hypothetical protein
MVVTASPAPQPPRRKKTTPITGVKRHFLDRQPPRWGSGSHPYKTFFGELMGEWGSGIMCACLPVEDVEHHLRKNKSAGAHCIAANLGLNRNGVSATVKSYENIIGNTGHWVSAHLVTLPSIELRNV